VSFLQAIPDRDLVITLLTNAPTGAALWADLGRWLFETLADVRMPGVPRPADPPPDLPLASYAGTYERLGVRYEITVADGALLLTSHVSEALADLQDTPAPPPQRLRPVSREPFYTADDEGEMLVLFEEFDGDRPGYLFTGRAARRVTSAGG
jgi:hypothetical protein